MARALSRKDARPQDWLVGGGEMGMPVRSMDWSTTPLGPIKSFPSLDRPIVPVSLRQSGLSTDRAAASFPPACQMFVCDLTPSREGHDNPMERYREDPCVVYRAVCKRAKIHHKEVRSSAVCFGTDNVGG
jgi:hypothetical protein